jgi:hypothetical protein
MGNVDKKGAHAGNATLLSWGEEGTSNPDQRVFVASNTFVNDHGSGRFLNIAAGGTLVAHNNLFVGDGSVSNGAALSADNLTLDPLFVDRAAYDYHLRNGSPAIGKAVDAGMADQFSLSPLSVYVHPLAEGSRDSVHDVGAYEFAKANESGAGMGATPGGAGAGASGSRTDPSKPAAGSGGTLSSAGRSATPAAGSGGTAGSFTPAKRSSSGCRFVAAPDASLLEPTLITILLGWGVARRSHRSRKSRPQRRSESAA